MCYKGQLVRFGWIREQSLFPETICVKKDRKWASLLENFVSDQTSYPLCWPEGWPRTVPARRTYSRFSKLPALGRRREISMAEACEDLALELDRLGAVAQILSTNVRLKLNGAPFSQQSQPTDPGAAIYFRLDGKPTSMACDKWLRVEDNVYAIAKHIEAMRGQERWGVGSIDRAFTGYQALPGIGQSGGIQWWSVLGVPVNADYRQVKDAYWLLAKKHHPDHNGDAELFRRVQEAWEIFNRTVKEELPT